MKKLMYVIGFVLCSIIIGCLSKDSGKQTSLYEDVSKEIPEKENDANTDARVTKDSTTEESSAGENITEAVILQNGYIFSTEYEVEDYCCGYFIVSKMDKILICILMMKGIFS